MLHFNEDFIVTFNEKISFPLASSFRFGKENTLRDESTTAFLTYRVFGFLLSNYDCLTK